MVRDAWALMMLASLLALAMCSGLRAEVEVGPGVTVDVFADDVPNPLGLSFDSEGVLYVAFDEGRSTPIRRISPDGSTVALFGPALIDPDSVAVDANDHIYVGSERGLYRLSPAGASTLVTEKNMGNNTCLAIDHAGVLDAVAMVYVGNARATTDIAKVDPNGAASSFVRVGALDIPFGLTFGPEYLYVAETSATPGVHRISADGSTSLVMAFTAPRAVAYNAADGMLYVGDAADEVIYRLSPDGEYCVFARSISPYGLTFGPGGSLYVADRSVTPHRILKISSSWHSLSGDINDDCNVDFLDFAMVTEAWHSAFGDPQWNADCDIDTPANDVVDLHDFIILAGEWLDSVGI